MSLRSRLLAAFAVLAVVPLLAVGVFDYWRTIAAVESLMRGQTSALATRAAYEIGGRFRDLQANAALLADNAEARALFMEHAAGRARESGSLLTPRRAALTGYLQDAWPAAGRGVLWASWRSPADIELHSIGSRSAAAGIQARPLRWDVRDEQGHLLGYLELGARLDSLLGDDALRAHFGREGLSAVVDEERQIVLAADVDESVATERIRAARVLAAETAGVPELVTMEAIETRVGDSTWIGTRASVEGTGLSVLTLASRDELSGPFTAIRNSNFAAVGALTMLVAMSFILLLWRGTAPLAELTVAADAVAAGNLSPTLPAAGVDEAGRLAKAFDYMLARVRSTLDEIERARRMAVIGEFASQISHEIRNPLTGLKLNLQKLDRAVRAGRVPADLQRPVEITRLEVDRLDRVVRGVLQLGQPAHGPEATIAIGEPLQRAIDAMRPDLERRGVDIIEQRVADHALVLGNAERLQSLVMNLLLNAAEAMPGGGRLRVSTTAETPEAVVVRIEDDGPGIPEEHRERVFTPFFTTKPEGTGLGLALAQRVVEEHTGRIVAEAAREGHGTAMVVTLPIQGRSR